MSDIELMRSRSGDKKSDNQNIANNMINEKSDETRPFLEDESFSEPSEQFDGKIAGSLNSPGRGAIANTHYQENPDFFVQARKFVFSFSGLLVSYLTWGYMQELIMTSQFEPTESSPDGKFPSAAFCVFSNRFLAIIFAMIGVKLKHGSIFNNNVAPLKAFTPCALSNTMSSWSQYASLRYVSFPVQTVFKSSKIIPVMIMGKCLKGTIYPKSQYVEALFITIGVAIFSVFGQEAKRETGTEMIGLIYMLMYICFDCFTSQWQDKIYVTYGRQNVDPFQMMLGVNCSAILITTGGLLITGDFPKVWEFFAVNPNFLMYNIVTAITSVSSQLFIFYTIKEFGPIVFTIIMAVRQMISICISAYEFGLYIKPMAWVGAILVFSVLFYQIRMAKKQKDLYLEAKEKQVLEIISNWACTDERNVCLTKLAPVTPHKEYCPLHHHQDPTPINKMQGEEEVEE